MTADHHPTRGRATIIVAGTLHVRPDTRAEPGCLEHGVAIAADDPFRPAFFEHWADVQAIGAPLKPPASRGFGKAVVARVDQPPTLSMFDATELPGG